MNQDDDVRIYPPERPPRDRSAIGWHLDQLADEAAADVRDWLRLGATPADAVLAVLTALTGGRTNAEIGAITRAALTAATSPE